MTIDKASRPLNLLDDQVLNPTEEKDAFGHQAYANLLASIFDPTSKNRTGLSVALFGKWGQGKSSIARMMQSELNEESDNRSGRVNIIWFNAWKSRGDHVRRQLLLSIIKGINSPNRSCAGSSG